MSIKDFYYKEIDGDHFPDATLGSNLFYGLDFSCWLNNESDLIKSVTWHLPKGVQSDDSFLQGNVGVVKLKGEHPGSFIINCILVSEETAHNVSLEQEKSIDIVLKVF